MAPPWDGDDLAGRAEEAAERGQAAVDERERRRVISSTTLGRELEEESLRMSRARTLDQLSRATNPAHRAMLEGALRALDQKATS